MTSIYFIIISSLFIINFLFTISCLFTKKLLLWIQFAMIHISRGIFIFVCKFKLLLMMMTIFNLFTISCLFTNELLLWIQFAICDLWYTYQEEFSFLYIIWTFVDDDDDDFQLLDPRVRGSRVKTYLGQRLVPM